MGRKEKLFEKIKSDSSFTWDETVSLLKAYGFKMHKNSGSSRKFINLSNGMVIACHEPHPQNTIKQYLKTIIIDKLNEIEIDG